MIEIAAYLSAITVACALWSALAPNNRVVRTAAGASFLLVAACLIGDALS